MIVEDGYDSEFVHIGRPIDALYSLDRDGEAVYVGLFSRTVLATLRLAYGIASPSLYPAIRKANVSRRLAHSAGHALWDGRAGRCRGDAAGRTRSTRTRSRRGGFL
jgi:hypothetical protein